MNIFPSRSKSGYSGNARPSGFSLIELLIALVIVGILASIGYANYTDYVRDTRRSEAKSALLAMATAQEKFFSRCRRYAAAMDPDPGNFDCGTAANPENATMTYVALTENRHYLLTIVDPGPGGANVPGCTTSNCFLLEADAEGAGTSTLQATDGDYRIDHVGRKTWDKRNIRNIDPATGGFRLADNTISLWAQRRQGKN